MTSQAEQIALHLELGHELTPMQALEWFGCFRLAARIKDLRARGYSIDTLDREHNGKRFAAYRLHRPIQHTLFDLSMPTVSDSAALAGRQARSSSLTTDANI